MDFVIQCDDCFDMEDEKWGLDFADFVVQSDRCFDMEDESRPGQVLSCASQE